jgi:hypothetical protein
MGNLLGNKIIIVENPQFGMILAGSDPLKSLEDHRFLACLPGFQQQLLMPHHSP